MSDKIYVTKPSMPPLADYLPYLEEIWESKILTNNGPFHQQLEQKLKEHLAVQHLSLFCNGTLALITALQALRITGEVITTPYSFVATTHALHWNGIKPVFADISPSNLGLSPDSIEAAITPQTSAIVPVHVYGQPCYVDEIQEIANKYGLKVVYDAAHAFGVNHKSRSILEHGDMSIVSFHATKVFHTFEGGAIICKDAETKQRIDYLKNFGFADETVVVAPGINAKMNELQAAFGLLQLETVDDAIAKRKNIDRVYRLALESVTGIDFLVPKECETNFSYFPVLIRDNFPLTRDDLFELLRTHGIFARRYFYPLISNFSTYRGLESAAKKNLPIANDIADKVLCLPIYPELNQQEQASVINAIKSAANGR